MGRQPSRSEKTTEDLSNPLPVRAATPSPALVPFLLGTAVGGIAGAVAGTLLSNATRSLVLGLLPVFGRRLTEAEREELRFELLLQ